MTAIPTTSDQLHGKEKALTFPSHILKIDTRVGNPFDWPAKVRKSRVSRWRAVKVENWDPNESHNFTVTLFFKRRKKRGSVRVKSMKSNKRLNPPACQPWTITRSDTRSSVTKILSGLYLKIPATPVLLLLSSLLHQIRIQISSYSHFFSRLT